MAATRKPLTIQLASRDSGATKDGRLTNCYSESGPAGSAVIKRFGISVQTASGVGCAQGAATFNGEAIFVKNNSLYSDLQPFSTGSTWTVSTTPTKPSSGQAFDALSKAGYMASLGGNLYHIGGKNTVDTNFGVYKSTDNGTSWSTVLAPASAPWTSVLAQHQMCVVFNGKIYICLETTSGSGIWEVWSSPDGATWTRTATNLAGASYIYNHGMVTSNGIMFAVFSNAALSAGAVFYSLDGITWSSATTAAGWNNRRDASVFALNGTLYVAGGVTSAGSYLNSVWSSVDLGVTWTQITAAGAFTARRGAAAFSYNNLLFIMGGSTAGGTYTNNIYKSVDGITWTLVTAASGWSARYYMSYSQHNGTMYIGPGYQNTSVTGLQYSAIGGATSTALTTPTLGCAPVQIALIPANGATVAKAFIKSTKDAWVWDGTSITKVTDVDYPATTVYGVAYLDGTIYVMDSKGVIYGSDLLAPTSWNALNFISAIAEADAGIAIARQLDNIIALKATSIEFFYDAGNASGSPLAKMQHALLEVGCAVASSLSASDNTLFLMSRHTNKGRSVMKFEGTTPSQVSTPWVDRILDADNLATVYSFVVRTNGYVFYVLTLKTSGITLMLNDTTKEWFFATKLSAYPAATVSSIAVQTDGSILVTMPLAHGAGDCDPVVIAGATPGATNGSFNLRYDTTVHSATQFSYVPATAVSGSITGTVTATLYTSSYFPGAYFASGSTVDLVMDEATGDIYKIDNAVYQDNASPIDFKIRTEREDFGTMRPKSYNSLGIVADNVSGYLAVRYCNDDYATFSKYRLVDLSKKSPRITQLGYAERRAWEFRYTGNTALRIQAAEPDIEGWR